MRLALDGRPVVLFGPNGAGKTNVLEAISMLSPGRGLRRALADELIRQPESLGWKIAAQVDDDTQIHEIELMAEPGQSRQTRIDGKLVPQNALAKLIRVLWLIPAMDRLWIEGSEGRRRFLDRTTMSFVPDHAEAVLAYEKAMRDRNRLLKDGVRDAHWYAALEGHMARFGAEIAANRRNALRILSEAQLRSDNVFPAGDLSLVGPDGEEMPETVDALRAAFSDGRTRDMAAGRTLVGPHRVDLEAIFARKGVPARQCSTGEQKALLISLILANARAIHEQTGAAPILLLDEVAAHLDEDRRRALYDEITTLGAQAFLTGTDSSLFTGFAERASVYHVTEGASASDLRETAL
jgi:DNA replication and repair protein RecF